MKESYETMQVVLTKLDYSKHNWVIWGDLKVFKHATVAARRLHQVPLLSLMVAEHARSTGREKHGLKRGNL